MLNKAFIIFSLFFSINQTMHSFADIADADKQSLVQTNETSVKEGVGQKVDGAIEQFKRFFSYDNQKTMVRWWTYLDIFKGALTYSVISDAKKLEHIPLVEKNLLNKINPAKVFSSESFGLNACALPNGKIILGEDLLNSTSGQEIEFVMAHEVAHVERKHWAKGLVLTGVLLISPLIVDVCMRKVKEKYKDRPDHPMTKVIGYYEKIRSVIANNPLLSMIVFKGVLSVHQCICEREADMIAAQTIGHANGGVDYFSRIQKIEGSTSWKSYLNPLSLFSRLEHALFSSHPRTGERISYLQNFEKSA